MRFKRTHVAGIIILILSWCTYQGYESLLFFRISREAKHFVNFGLLLSVFGVGYYGFYKYPQKWVTSLWVIMYVLIITLMLLIGILDLKYKFRISNFREMVHNLRMFFTSPVPFGILLLLHNKTKDKKIAPAPQKL